MSATSAQKDQAKIVTCKASGCKKPLPQLAILHDDPYCSTDCCKKEHDCYVGGAVSNPSFRRQKPGTAYTINHKKNAERAAASNTARTTRNDVGRARLKDYK